MTFPAPFASVLCSINGGTATAGAQTVVSTSATLQLSAVSTANWQSALWEIYDYPPGYSTPSGWTLNGTTGAIQYNANGGSPNPPVVTMQYWGKLGIRLTVNQGIDPTGVLNPVRMVDTSCALTMLSPNGLRDMFAGEGSQFGGFRSWVGDHKSNLRVMEAIAGGYMHIPVWTINATAGGTISDAGPSNIPAYITEVTGTPGAAFILKNGGASQPAGSGFWTIVRNQTLHPLQYCVSPATTGPIIGPGQTAFVSYDGTSATDVIGPVGGTIISDNIVLVGAGTTANSDFALPAGTTVARVTATATVTTAAGGASLGDCYTYQSVYSWSNVGGTFDVPNHSGTPWISYFTSMSACTVAQSTGAVGFARVTVNNPPSAFTATVTWKVTVETVS